MSASAELVAPAAWRTVEILSDLHLQAAEPGTFEAWRDYLLHTTADAVLLLGDLFELWVGDDAADEPGFEARCAEVLANAARERPLFFMHGNRDFLVGPALAARCGFTLLGDPTVLVMHSRRHLLSHGDLLCLGDTDYLAFRARVRQPDWQRNFLSKPLAERRSLGRAMRTQSEDRKRDPAMTWADVDAEAARSWLQAADATTLIHGHTHRPAMHELGDGLSRIVLSDWDASAQPPRAQVLRLSADGVERVDLV